MKRKTSKNSGIEKQKNVYSLQIKERERKKNSKTLKQKKKEKKQFQKLKKM